MLDKKILAKSFLSTKQESLKLSDFLGKCVVIYFYPKDNTPGCTTETINFNERYTDFVTCNTEIVGVSRDSIASHQKFAQKHNLQFPLISDEDSILCNAFSVIKEKKLFANTFLGIERSTFFINEKGELVESWRKVKVPGHVDKVLAFVKNFQSTNQ